MLFTCGEPGASGCGIIFSVVSLVGPTIFMNKSATDQALLQLLVRVYNQSIQFYYHFPDVIICGNLRLEREEFDFLLKGGYLETYHTDSFGKIYRVSKRAELLLYQSLGRRRYRHSPVAKQNAQAALPF